MKAKRIARCLTVKNTGRGSIRVAACGAGNAQAKGFSLWHRVTIQAVKNHIVVIALSAGPAPKHSGRGRLQIPYSVFQCVSHWLPTGLKRPDSHPFLRVRHLWASTILRNSLGWWTKLQTNQPLTHSSRR
ncbi:hypothetical protein SDC9_73690 [bioreactor metagenome]|uniref:Uncharacterized protein n=1 Tax=bioreactor metagenome TaxID=1076179 RepID=A0A644YFG2_9ZZZZ